MYPHRIRLRGPWEWDAGGRSGRLTMPCSPGDAGRAGLAGAVRFRRRFGYPGRIDDHERVWLVMGGVGRRAEVCVNGVSLGAWEGDGEHDVTALLGPRNELTVGVASLAAGDVLWEEAALEVRCQAYLRRVRAERVGGEIRVSGEVVGRADGPLELYLVADRSPAAYLLLGEGGEVRPFTLTGPGVDGQGAAVASVQLDLVQGATVWYSVETQPPALAARRDRA